ncbi:MAG: GNAT family N-acetyltransferase [Pseudomonadota bacterium]
MENIVHNPSEKRFTLMVENAQAVLQYRLFKNENNNNTIIDFTSTFVPPEFRGKGLAEKLVRAGITWAKEQGYELQASCWYVAKFIR